MKIQQEMKIWKEEQQTQFSATLLFLRDLHRLINDDVHVFIEALRQVEDERKMRRKTEKGK